MRFRTIICEDESSIRVLLKLAAEMRGHEVITFPCPPTFCILSSEGVCSYGLSCCDAILSDHQMPGMSGLEFFDVLKRKKCLVPSRALVTAAAQEDVKKLACELGCSFIPKPFQLRDIDAWLEKAEANVQESRQLLPCKALIDKHKSLH